MKSAWTRLRSWFRPSPAGRPSADEAVTPSGPPAGNVVPSAGPGDAPDRPPGPPPDRPPGPPPDRPPGPPRDPDDDSAESFPASDPPGQWSG
jgi:hypothetical protein